MRAEGKRQGAEGKYAKSKARLPFILRPSSPILAAAALLLTVALSGCGTPTKRDPGVKPPPPRPGGYYLDDGPGDKPPVDLDGIPDAVPRVEPLHRGASRPYVVMGRHYTPMTALAPYKARGVATWYGRRYHGRMTSSGEPYDMYRMTAAHPMLPIPSYARVTNLQNGRSVVVRINDRGPFIDNRLIDVSYTAAHKLGMLASGSAQVEVESIIPDAAAPMVAQAPRPAAPPPARESPPPEPAPPAAAGLPEVQPAPPSPAPEVPLTVEAGGFYLQLAAFGSRENAESFLARLKAQLDWLAQALHLYARDGLIRVHAGPYANESEARRAADRVGEALGAKPLVLVR